MNALAIAGLSLFLSILATPGIAHTELIGSTPSASSEVTVLPKHLVLSFSEPPLTAGTFVRIEQQQGKSSSKIAGKLVGSSVQFDWPGSITPGEIKVYWRAVADDGHVVSGDFNFFYKSVATPTITQAPERENSQTKQIVTWGGIAMLLVLAAGIVATTKSKD